MDDYTSYNNLSDTATIITLSSIGSRQRPKSANAFSIPKYLTEEKRVKVIQEGLHKKIINLGDNLHNDLISRLSVEYDEKYKAKEKELSERLKRDKDFEVNLYREKCEVKLTAIRSQIKSEYEKITKEKIIEIEIFNQNVAREQIEKNRLEAKRQLEETIYKLKKDAEIEKKLMKDELLAIEEKIANERVEEQKRIYEAKLHDLNEQWIKKLNDTVKELKEKSIQEKERAVDVAIENVKNEEAIKLEKCIEKYEDKIDMLKNEYNSRLDNEAKLQSRITTLQYEKEQIKQLLDESKMEFQKFFEQFTQMKNGDADFLFVKN